MKFFVKVGSHDGISWDPFGTILLNNSSWSGLLIEPVPHCYKNLKVNFSDPARFITERMAIDTHNGYKPFYYVSEIARVENPSLPIWCDQLGSFDRGHILKHLDGILEPYIIEVDVRCDALSNILSIHHIQDISFLMVDAEGYDLEVVKSLDFDRWLPHLISIEHKHLIPEDRNLLVDILRSNGYAISDLGGDFFAHRSSAEIISLAQVVELISHM